MNQSTLVLHPDSVTAIEVFITIPAHAAVLVGAAGTGKTHIARMIAERLLGSSAASGNNPYYREVIPAKGVITIEQIRQLIQFFQLSVPGAIGTKRVAVLQDADTMGREAQNALLKLLEEPPEGSVLLLTTAALTALLPTIRSRARALTLLSPTPQQIIDHFTGQGFPAPTVQKAALRHGDNIAAIAAVLMEAPGTDTSLELVKEVLGGTTYDRLLLVDRLSKQKEAASDFTDTLATVASASLEAAAGKGAALDRWQTILQATYTARGALQHNGNVKLVLTELMLGL